MQSLNFQIFPLKFKINLIISFSISLENFRYNNNLEKMLNISKISILIVVIIFSIQNVFNKHQTQINNDLISSSSSSIEENYYLPEINHDFIKLSPFRPKRNKVRKAEILKNLKKQHNIQHYPDNERFRKMFKIIFG